jgi:hypothetical protein
MAKQYDILQYLEQYSSLFVPSMFCNVAENMVNLSSHFLVGPFDCHVYASQKGIIFFLSFYDEFTTSMNKTLPVL